MLPGFGHNKYLSFTLLDEYHEEEKLYSIRLNHGCQPGAARREHGGNLLG